jgi:hypothetical protein
MPLLITDKGAPSYLAFRGITYSEPDEHGEREWRLPADHPYAELGKGEVYENRRGRWVVQYRDFFEVKQDRDFDNREEAEAFAATLPQLVFKDDNFGPVEMAEFDWEWHYLKELREKEPLPGGRAR